MNIFEVFKVEISRNFRAKANQHKSVPIKPQDKLLVCNGQQVFLAILDELLKYCIIDRQNTIKLFIVHDLDPMKWSTQTQMKCMERMTVMELTNAVSWSTARVEHSKHAER